MAGLSEDVLMKMMRHRVYLVDPAPKVVEDLIREIWRLRGIISSFNQDENNKRGLLDDTTKSD